MTIEKGLGTCPWCDGSSSTDVTRGWFEDEWSDFSCHYCQQDFFKWQIAEHKSGDKDTLE